MNKCTLHIFILIMLSSLVSCKDKEQEKEMMIPYARIYKVDNVDYDFFDTSFHIIPNTSFDESFDESSRAFYKDRDSVLMYNVNADIPSYKWGYAAYLCAMDWRINRISVVTLEDFDTEHPAGSALDDMLFVEYMYKRMYQQKQLVDMYEGEIMLTDYEPYEALNVGVASLEVILQSEAIKNGHSLHSIRVCTTDAFGREFITTLGVEKK